ncbi:calcium/sodium antiporter [Bacillus sp. HMF5848]|uniref:calcium/sodium antiporter n=1 Tax=Bacillus sp. HMF5848 TaxID=2495421 RepID=UPI000F7A85F7|nr:calcium/sodium antiporter [Bacillus sp. HMF5848]RSK28095.1 calcium/sodium antiporter [Bacillus sp. HMF5848]
MSYLLLIVGFVLLIKGADFFVDGASKIATFLNISPLIIGLTIVAFGTSSPEGTVSIIAALEGNADVAVANIVGSSIFNITLVIGLTALFNPLKVENSTIRKEIPFTLLASIAMYILILDSTTVIVSRNDGIILLLFFAVFMYYIIEAALNNKDRAPLYEIDVPTEKTSITKSIMFTLGGLLAIIFGGELVVSSSIKIALALGMSETLVGLTVVALGTSLPELITSIVAAIKKMSEIALGNIIGSNIFNLLFVLGIASVVAPLPVDTKIFTDAVILIVLTIILFLFSRSKHRISKLEGLVLTLAYIGYMTFIIIRN